MKKIVLYSILFIWMIIIFLFSNQQKEKSNGLSDKIIEDGITIVEKLNNTKIDAEKRKEIHKYAVFPLRKVAHVTIYFILGIIVCNLVLTYNANLKKILFLSIFVCLIYATTDEIHQLFISGRTGNLLDILIDTCGSTLGILLAYKLFNKKICK